MNFDEYLKKLDKMPRNEYIKVYKELGNKMFSNCYIPNVGDFASAIEDNNEDAKQTIERLTSFTGNSKDILESLTRRNANYTESESAKFINSVIAANVSDITAAGTFYKYVISSSDNMFIDEDYEDCRSVGYEVKLPIEEKDFNFKIRNRFVNELNDYASSYDDFLSKTKDMKSIHIRTFTTCNHSRNHRKFCKKCAGLYRREHNSTFVPKHIGIYSSLMITEQATQASLDSMNKGTSEKLNVLLEQRIDKDELLTYPKVLNKIHEIIDNIGFVGVESRFYEIALLSRMYLDEHGKWYAAPLSTSFMRQKDEFGAFIYRPNKNTFMKMIKAGKIDADSTKSKIALDNYK